ncbi:MAG TPA: DNA polymerase III subunit delta' C-terminal domain-containing protein [Pseudobacteroides sp.]|nr:DNA polymerase III subunit delta' C-terminal domain-containing protein [Pseudobacteroides sp.]
MKGILENSIKANKVFHAYAFTGPKGIGKKTFAKAYSGLLLCQKQSGDEKCGQCFACKTFDSNTNPDIHIIDPGDGSISVEEIRSMQNDVIIKPLYSARKVYLIFEADKMTVQAQNCLLKTLEEPPSYAVIILTASNYEALMETIRSRVLRLSFKKYSNDELKAIIERNLDKPVDNIDFVLSFSDGIAGNALEIAGSEEFIRLREETIQVVLSLHNNNVDESFKAMNFMADNKGVIDTVLDIMMTFFRDLLIYKKTGDEKMLINSDKKGIILNNVDKFTLKRLGESIELIENTKRILQQNANFQLSMEVMLMKLQEE